MCAFNAYLSFIRDSPGCITPSQHMHLGDMILAMRYDQPDWFAIKTHHPHITGRSGNNSLWQRYLTVSMQRRLQLIRNVSTAITIKKIDIHVN